MKFKMFVIRDVQVGDYGRPMFMQSTGQALRAFSDEINRADKDNMMYQHPEDFELFLIGEFDSESARFENGVLEQLATGKNCVIQKQ